jgi:hypothetical protein
MKNDLAADAAMMTRFADDKRQSSARAVSSMREAQGHSVICRQSP